MAMIEFRRSRTGVAVAVSAAAVAFAIFMFAPFPDDTSAGRRLFFSCLLGGFAAFGVWGLAGIPALVADVVASIRGAGARRASPAAHHTGPLPELSQRRQGDVRRIVRVMASHGLFSPDEPDPTRWLGNLVMHDSKAERRFRLELDGRAGSTRGGGRARRERAGVIEAPPRSGMSETAAATLSAHARARAFELAVRARMPGSGPAAELAHVYAYRRVQT